MGVALEEERGLDIDISHPSSLASCKLAIADVHFLGGFLLFFFRGCSLDTLVLSSHSSRVTGSNCSFILAGAVAAFFSAAVLDFQM